MTLRYAVHVEYLCHDPDCCVHGGPFARCSVCGQPWPCNDYRAAHTPAQVARQERWVKRLRGRG